MSVPKWFWWAVAAVAFYYFVLRNKVTGGALATGTVSVGTGVNSTPYPGYPAGYAPVTAQAPAGTVYGPIVPTSSNSGAAWLGATGQFIGGLGAAASGIIGALGGAGLIGSSSSGSSSSSSWGSSSSSWGSGPSTYPADDFDFELF